MKAKQFVMCYHQRWDQHLVNLHLEGRRRRAEEDDVKRMRGAT
jgi:hypothetical protein